MPTSPNIAAVGGSGIPVSDLVRRFQAIMMDYKSIRWSAQEVLDWLNDGAREVIFRHPAARSVTENRALVAGTFQSASDDAAQVLDVTRNIVGGRASKAIGIVDRQQLDRVDPDWHIKRAGITRHYMIDERSPTSFYVYPPAIEGAVIEMLVSKLPPKVAALTEVLDIRPEFLNAILNWMMYRAHSKDSEYSQGNMAALHYQAFTAAIGEPAQIAQVNSATGNSK